MAHPYESSRADKVGSSRAKSFTNGYARGGGIKHSDEAQDKKLIKSMLKKEEAKETKVEGRATGGRLDKFARGGRTKKGKAGTQVNIAIVQPKGGSSAPDGAPGGGGLPALAGPPPLPPKPPMMPPPGPMGPPGMAGPPGGPPPGMGKPPGMLARGGKVTGQKGGAATGVGRLDISKMTKAR